MMPVGRWIATVCLLFLTSGQGLAKTLVFCSEAAPESLNPQTVTSVTGMNAADPMFDGLVRFRPGGGAIVPALAESWAVSPDGTEYTFHLRKGVKFHANQHFTPTRTFNADDVLFSFNRQWRDDNPYHHPPGTSFDYFQDMEMPKLLSTIDRIDDYTIRFRLSHAEAPFLADLAMPFTKILSAEYAATLLKAGTPDLLDQEPIGTGPFAFESYRKDMTVRYRAFDYWGGRPHIDTLVFAITPNVAVRLTKLKAGECHVMSFPSPADAEKVEQDPQLTLLRQEGLNVGYLALNASRPPFDDVRVRRAVNMAIDKATLVRVVYGRSGAPAKNPLPPTLWSYNDAVEPYPYDPVAAQHLMSEAGLDKGTDADLWYMPVTRAYNPDSRRVAEMVADDLAHIGIRVQLKTAPWADYREKVLAGATTMAFYGWTSDNGDPDNFLGILLGCHEGQAYANNIAKWCDADYDALITRAKRTSNSEERAKLYGQAQVIAHDQAPWVPIAHAVVLGAIHKTVKGFQLDPFGRFLFSEVDLVQD
jgi:dipeptide transport system substrate-binding protein